MHAVAGFHRAFTFCDAAVSFRLNAKIDLTSESEFGRATASHLPLFYFKK
jgi:hypothetical protein